MKIIYDKLVRDNIPRQIKEEGSVPNYYTEQNDEGYWMRLISKLHEEVTELGDDRSAQEMADVIEVIYAICEFQGIDLDEVETIRSKKKFIKGGFSKRYILKTVN